MTSSERALLFGAISAIMAGVWVKYGFYPSAVFNGLFSIYWFVLAAVREPR